VAALAYNPITWTGLGESLVLSRPDAARQGCTGVFLMDLV